MLGIDAFSFDRLNIEGKKYAFCFYCQPISPYLKCFPLYLLPSQNGKANKAIVDVISKLANILKSNGINVIYSSSDGDGGYNKLK